MNIYPYSYDTLKNKYDKFQYPNLRLEIGGVDFMENKAELVLSELEVQLSSGYESSVANFRYYNSYNYNNGEYQFDKYKKFVYLGSDVMVKLGYGNETLEIFRGFISQVRFVSEEGDPHHIEITAMDVKGMMMANCYAMQLTAKAYSEAVKEIFNKAAYQKMLSMGIYKSIRIAETPDKQKRDGSQTDTSTIEMVLESDYEFVVKAAKKYNYEFFVDSGTVIFRKAKDAANDCLIRLGPQEGLYTYEIEYDITSLVNSIEVRGMDTGKGNVITAQKKCSNKFSKGNKVKALLSQTKKVYLDAASNSREEAQYRAESLMEDMSYRLGKIECECVGLPELKPGEFVEISGLGSPADNKFYITNVTHIFNDIEGFHTKLSGKAAAIV